MRPSDRKRQHLRLRGQPFDLFYYVTDEEQQQLVRQCRFKPRQQKIGDLTPADAYRINRVEMFSAADFGGDVRVRHVYDRRLNLVIFFVWGFAQRVAEHLGLTGITIEGAATDLPAIYIIGACSPEHYMGDISLLRGIE